LEPKLIPRLRLSGGTISINGIDISTLGLTTLRQAISMVPQDAHLFAGSLRSQLDPFDKHTDETLWAAMRSACLLEAQVESDTQCGDEVTSEKSDNDVNQRQQSSAEGHRKRFNLDTTIESGGSNLSVGERSLVSLARAIVKDSQIVVIDEATASVDPFTDSRIQSTIRTEFRGKTLLVIAHRLSTVIGYDRILVMNDGKVDAFGTPMELWAAGGIFGEMCNHSKLCLEDIEKAQEDIRTG
jgi:ATP-binding cassette, subfamily C (CFTR/MRP), member 1